jgi:hypothetical protein
VELDGETLGAGEPLFGDPVAGAVDPDVPVPDVPDVPVPVPDVPVPDVPVPVPDVPLPEVLEPELADPVPDGEGLGEGFVLGLLVGVGVGLLDEVGCGAAADVDAEVGDGCVVGGGEDFAVAMFPPAVEPEGAHDGTGMDLSAIAGMSGLRALGPGSVEPFPADCAAAACEPLPLANAAELVACDSTGGHCGPVFVAVGGVEGVALGVLEVVIVPGPEPPDVFADPGPGTPPPLVPGRSTLAAWPPVSTLELTCTTACRSGATASVALTANATPASTETGRNQPRPPAPLSAARIDGDSLGKADRKVSEERASRPRQVQFPARSMKAMTMASSHGCGGRRLVLARILSSPSAPGRTSSTAADSARRKACSRSSSGAVMPSPACPQHHDVSCSRIDLSADIPRAVWLFTAPRLIPIAVAISASEKSP